MKTLTMLIALVMIFTGGFVFFGVVRENPSILWLVAMIIVAGIWWSKRPRWEDYDDED